MKLLAGIWFVVRVPVVLVAASVAMVLLYRAVTVTAGEVAANLAVWSGVVAGAIWQLVRAS